MAWQAGAIEAVQGDAKAAHFYAKALEVICIASVAANDGAPTLGGAAPGRKFGQHYVSSAEFKIGAAF